MRPQSLHAIFDSDFAPYLLNRDRMPNTATTYRTTIAMLGKFLGRDATTADLTAGTIAAFMEWFRASTTRLNKLPCKSTVDNRLKSLQRFWKWCYRRKLVDTWPDVSAKPSHATATIPIEATMSLDEVAKVFGVNRTTLYKWRARGVFGDCVVTPTGDARIPVAAIQSVVDARKRMKVSTANPADFNPRPIDCFELSELVKMLAWTIFTVTVLDAAGILSTPTKRTDHDDHHPHEIRALAPQG